MEEELRIRLLNAVSGILNGLHELQGDYAREVHELTQLRRRYQEAAAELSRLRTENIRLRAENIRLRDQLELIRRLQELEEVVKK